MKVNKHSKQKIQKEICKLFDDSSKIILKSKSLSSKIESSIEIILDTLKMNKKIIIIGNGGSAADAQHMAAEFIGRYLLERMVRDIRSLSHILGDGKKIIWNSELPAKKKLREIFV